jgi:asparagine synthetase B (glutamine-hydrolysing)
MRQSEGPDKSILVMFSGGIDSTLLVALIAEVLRAQDKVKPSEVSIDLINVSFSPDTSSDRITGIFSYYELKK